MKTTNNKKGFTIIEAVLVLAIAGLIFMMVFLALPALQRSQRDTARSTDMARVITALNNYQANNRGRLPSELGDATISAADGDIVSGNLVDSNNNAILGHTIPNTKIATNAKNTGSWLYFYDNYLIINSGGSTDTFLDPDGEPYSLALYECKTDGIKENEACLTGQRYNVTFAAQSAGGDISGEGNTSSRSVPSHSVAVVQHAACDGEVVKYAGARKIAIVYKKEGAGTICLTN